MCVQSSEGYHKYISGCSVHWEDIMMHVEGYHEYIRGCSVHWGILWVHQGYIMSISGDVQYIGGISWCMWGSKLIKVFQVLLKTPMYWTSPNVLMISPRCTHDIPPMYSWYHPHASWYPPHASYPPMYWTSPDVLMISPDVLMISPQHT